MSEQTSPDKNNKEEISQRKKNLAIFGIISSWIVGPIVGALLLGDWLDEKYQRDYFFTLTLIAIAFIITCVGIGREALKAFKEFKD
jgi:MFS family permease